MKNHPDIRDLTPDSLASVMTELGQPRYRADQVLNWLYKRNAASWDCMTDLSKQLRKSLSQSFEIYSPVIQKEQVSTDGTRKFLMGLSDGQSVESVWIPETDRVTLCVSTQVGCRMGCRYCRTASMGLLRDLRPSEIVGQVIAAIQKIPDRPLTHVVLMGMGEPLDNFDNSVASVRIMTSTKAMGISTRRVTLSTVGIAPGIPELGKAVRMNLAVSLTAGDDATRTRLMPINKRYPLKDLIRSLKKYPLAPRRKIFFEVVLLRGVNDSDRHARSIASIADQVRSVVNLIPFNPYPGSKFKAPEPDRVLRFQKILKDKNIFTVIRTPRGSDISAACGQLVTSDKERERIGR